MGNFKKYLESSVLDEHEIVGFALFHSFIPPLPNFRYALRANATENLKVTYRILARKLEVHVNVAKQMLYQFHNSHKKDGSVYATYIITGERKEMIDGAEDEDEDEDMSGSPFGFTPQEKKEKFRYQKVVKLVGEERLEGLFFSLEMVWGGE